MTSSKRLTLFARSIFYTPDLAQRVHRLIVDEVLAENDVETQAENIEDLAQDRAILSHIQTLS